jgi:hypothetical protein
MAVIDELIQAQIKEDQYYIPSGKLLVPRAKGDVQGYKDVRIYVQNDADFYIDGLTGSYGYWFSPSGKQWEDPTLDFSYQALGTGDWVLQQLPINGFEEVVFRAIDGASNRLLSGDYVAVETFFTGGGVGKPLYMKMPFRHITLRNSFIRFEFQNATNQDFQIDFTLHGRKFF